MSALSSLLVRLHSLPFDYAPFFDDSILLTLIIALSNPHPSHLVLRIGTQSDDLSSTERAELTERVEAELVWILQVIFHLVPHIVTCHSKTSASAFIKSLLLPIAPPPAPLTPTSPSPSHLPNPRRAASYRSENSLRASTIKARPRSNTLTQLVNEAAAESGRAPRSPTLSIAGSTFRLPTSPSYSSSLLGQTGTLVEDPDPYSAQSTVNAEDSSAGEDLYPASIATARSASSRAKSPESFVRRRGNSASTTHSLLLSPQSGQGSTPRKYGSLGSRRGSELSVSVGQGESHPMLRRPTSPTPGTSSRSTHTIGSKANQRSPTPGSASGLSYFGHQTHGASSKLGERRPSIQSVASQYELAPSSPLLTPGAPAAPRNFRSRSNSPGANKALSPTAPAGPVSPLSQASPTMSAASRRPSSTLLAPPMGASPSTARPRSAERRDSRRMWEQEEFAARQLPQVVILSRVERARKSAQHALLDVLREGRLAFGDKRRPSLTLQAEVQSNKDDASQQGEDSHTSEVKMLPSNFLVIALVCERSKARNEDERRAAADGGWGGVSRHLLDRFAYSHTVSLEHTLRHPNAFLADPDNVPPPAEGAPPPLESGREALSPRALEEVWLSPALTAYISDLFSTLRSHPLLESRMLSIRAERELDALLRVWVALSSRGTVNGEKGTQEAEQTVLPTDVLSVLLGVVGHRVVMRDVCSEKSVFWGASEARLARRREGRAEVESVLREVVREV